jgi:hypothetical protein
MDGREARTTATLEVEAASKRSNRQKEGKTKKLEKDNKSKFY